jgi:hypothetical protein
MNKTAPNTYTTVPFGAFPDNCNVMEYTGDVGRCWFHLKKGVCPRHGKVK